MTFQIGLVGRDGVLLASDTRHTQASPYICTYRSTLSFEKIEQGEQQGVLAYCCAGDDLSVLAARALGDEILKNTCAPSKEGLLLTAKAVIDQERERAKQGDYAPLCGGTVLLVYRDCSQVQLWKVRVQPHSPLQLDANRVTDHVKAGDETNPAHYFVEQCYPRDRTPKIEELLPLAAHTILMAGKLNPAQISGLEIILCRPSGFERVPDDKIALLNAGSEKLCSQIANSLVLLGSGPQI